MSIPRRRAAEDRAQFARAMHAPVFPIAGAAMLGGVVATVRGLWRLITG